MKRSRILFVLLLVSLLMALVTATALAGGSDRNFGAHLSGQNEVPANDSKGTGQALVRISKDETSLTFKLMAANIDGVTQAHIHCGPPTANGPVVLFLYGFNPDGISPTGLFSEGTATDADVIDRDPSEVCPGGVTGLADLIAQIRAGNAYVNVHTLAIPGGEIRGQLH